jgi:hypothetical protein
LAIEPHINSHFPEIDQRDHNGEMIALAKKLRRRSRKGGRRSLRSIAVCAAINSEESAGERMEFHSDPTGGDGIIVDTRTNETWPTEHVLVPMPRSDAVPDIETSIANAVDDKQQKGGAAYAS